MYNFLRLLNIPYGYYHYIWVDVKLLKETKKAILIEFDGRQAWLPKVLIRKIKRHNYNKYNKIHIKISLYHWAKKY